LISWDTNNTEELKMSSYQGVLLMFIWADSMLNDDLGYGEASVSSQVGSATSWGAPVEISQYNWNTPIYQHAGETLTMYTMLHDQ